MLRGLLLLFLVFSFASAAHAQDTTTDTVPSTVETGFGVLAPSFQTTLLTILFIAALLIALYMVLFFARRLQSAAFLRTSLVESVKRQILDDLVRDLDDQTKRGPLDMSDLPPENFPVRCLADANYQLDGDWGPYSSTGGSEGWGYADMSEEERKKAIQEEADRKAKREAWFKPLRDWRTAEVKRYEAKKLELAAIALIRAEEQVPKSLDVSLLGGGFSFVLEFSTVIVIIFALLVLTALRSIDGREVATILAAVAGYVLGKTTSSSADRGAANVTNPTTVTTTQPAATSSSLTAGKTFPTQT
jgi:hypothetical protein